METKPVTHPFGVTLFETVPAYPSGSYELEVMGFGAKTSEEAESEAARLTAYWSKKSGRPVRADFHCFCTTCHVSGIEPGFKKKKCSKCSGSGRLPYSADPIVDGLRAAGIKVSRGAFAEDKI